jgi:hypothetical protein
MALGRRAWCAIGGFLLLFVSHVNRSTLNSTWLGPVSENYSISPAESGPYHFSGQRRHHIYNRQDRSHAAFRAETLQRKNGLNCRSTLGLAPRPSRPSSFLTEFLTLITTLKAWSLPLWFSSVERPPTWAVTSRSTISPAAYVLFFVTDTLGKYLEQMG